MIAPTGAARARCHLVEDKEFKGQHIPCVRTWYKHLDIGGKLKARRVAIALLRSYTRVAPAVDRHHGNGLGDRCETATGSNG